MFAVGSLFWVLYTFLKYHLLILAYFTGIIAIAYGMLRFAPKRVSPTRRFQLNKLLYGIAIGQILMLFASALYIIYHMGWSYMPTIGDSLRFALNPSHFILLGTAPYFGMMVTLLIIKAGIPLGWADIGLRRPEGGKRANARLVVYGVLVTVGINFIWGHFVGISEMTETYLAQILKSVNLGYRILRFLWLIVAVPVIEELFIRGTIFAMLSEIGGFRIALILQAMLFALLHQEAIVSIPVFFAGCIMGYAYYKSKSIVVSGIIHGALNATTLLVATLVTK